MKKLLCLALAIVMCVSLFAGCGKYDMEGADLESYVTLCDIDSISYDGLVEHYNNYRAAKGASMSTFYVSAGYRFGFEVTAEIVNADGSVAEW